MHRQIVLAVEDMLNGYVLSMALFRLTRVAQVGGMAHGLPGGPVRRGPLWKIRRTRKVTARRLRKDAGTLECKTRCSIVRLELCN